MTRGRTTCTRWLVPLESCRTFRSIDIHGNGRPRRSTTYVNSPTRYKVRQYGEFPRSRIPRRLDRGSSICSTIHSAVPANPTVGLRWSKREDGAYCLTKRDATA